MKLGDTMIVRELKVKKEIEKIKKFRLSDGSTMMMNGNVVYEFISPNTLKYKPCGIEEQKATTIKVDENFQTKLEEILRENHTEKWDGFQGSNPNVLDGDSFYFTIDLEEYSIDAMGYMSYPKNYGVVRKEIENLFQEYLPKEK